MIWKVFFACSITILALAIAAAGILMKKKRTHGGAKGNPFYIVLAGILASATLLFVPIYQLEASTGGFEGFKTFVFAIRHAVRLFKVDYEYAAVVEGASVIPEGLAPWYVGLMFALYIIAPLMTIGFLLSFVKRLSSYVRYFACYFNDVYIFSELNERAIVLARDVLKNNEDARVVFTEVFGANEETSFGLIEQANELGAICFKKDISSINFSWHSKRKTMSFFTIGMDETENISQSLDLMNKYYSRENSRLYIFSIGVESELLLAGVDRRFMKNKRVKVRGNKLRRIESGKIAVHEIMLHEIIVGAVNHKRKKNSNSDRRSIKVCETKVRRMPINGTVVRAVTINHVIADQIKKRRLSSMRKMKIHRVSEAKSLITRILYDEGTRLFENANTISAKEKQISAVVVGTGLYGTEMLKSLAWYCQMDGYSVDIHAFDKDELAEDKFTFLCPELMSPEYNGFYVDGEAQYKITFHSGFDVDTKRFADEISTLRDTTYVLVALGTDEDNIRAAVNIRMLFERIGAKPIIHAVVHDSKAVAALRRATNFKGQQYNIDYIGDLESSYSDKVIIDSEVEDEAFKIHKSYCQEDDYKIQEFWKYEYNYRSSVASAVHAKARAFCGIPGALKLDKDRTDEEREINSKIEHRRWNAYMRADGYIFSGEGKDGKPNARNDLAKMHNTLVCYKDLTDEYRQADRRVSSGK